MLSNDILSALKSYTATMQNAVTFVLQTGEHDKRAELLEFLTQVTSTSAHINLEERDTGLRSPISFELYTDKATGIQFTGIPSGHEFNSLVLSILWASGTAMKLDEALQQNIARLDQRVKFEVFVSLDCHNCPDAVQALNQFALINDNISSEMIDGGLFQDELAKRDIQGVPVVFLNGKRFANGKINISEIVNDLAERFPIIRQADNQSNLPLQDVTVIGGGPAGTAAAIYSARKGLKVSLIADRIGGQVKDTMSIENFISVSSTSGPQLAGDLQAHIDEYDITIKQHVRVDSIENGLHKKLQLSSGEIIESKSVILATGANWRELGIPGEQENVGNGVAYCPHCDGPFFKGKDVAVIGGGNSGIEAALDLSGIVKSVTVFEFMPELKADSVLVEQTQKRGNITILKNVAAKQILTEDGKVSAIEYEERQSGANKIQPLAGVFVQIGLIPNSQLAENLVERTQHGEIIIDEKCQTSEAGIFACGDVTTVPYKQIVIAMGEGSKASLAAFEYLLTYDTLSADSNDNLAA